MTSAVLPHDSAGGVVTRPARSISVVVPIRTGRGQNDREHWAAKAKRVKAERQAVHWMLLDGRARWLPPCTVTLTRVAPSNGLDGDNLQGSLKACRDGVADWLKVDDRDARVTWAYAQERGKPKEYAVRVEVREVAT